MSRYCLIVDYSYCTGCKACEVACNQEYGRPLGLTGIKVFESTMKLNDKFYINYMPTRTGLCTFCAGRIKKGKRPSCVQHCLSGCLSICEAREIVDLVGQKDKMMFL